MATVFRGPIFSGGRDPPSVVAVVFTAGFLLTLAPVAAPGLPVGAQQVASAPSILRINADMTRGQPITLQTVVPPAPIVVAPHFAPLRFWWQPPDTSSGTAKVLYADQIPPRVNLPYPAPDAVRPVRDTSLGSSLALLSFVQQPQPPGQTAFVAAPRLLWQPADMTWESSQGALQGVQPAPPPTDFVPPPAQAGSLMRKHRRIFVEIDGELFRVNSQQEAVELIEQAQALAKEVAPKAVAKGKPVVPVVKVKAGPDLGQLQTQAADANAAIEAIYREAYALAQAQDDDDEDAITMLLLH